MKAAGGRLEAKLAKLAALRDAGAPERVAALRRALRDANNYLVAQAADIASDAGDAEVIPDLLDVYGVLFGDDAAERDPLVWAKTAIARALRALGHRDPAPFVRGLHHVQLEPVWGKLEDHAANLRCACAQALVDTDLPVPSALRELVPLLVDPTPMVRVEAIAALSQIGGDEAVLLLRLKACTGDKEAEVVGACFSAIFDREPAAALAFVAPFLDDEDDAVCTEAAAALALSRDPAAIDHVRAFLRRPLSRDVREGVVAACAGSPQPAIADLLMEIVRGHDAALAERAVRALGQSRFRDAVRQRVRDATRRGGRLAAVYAEAFGEAADA